MLGCVGNTKVKGNEMQEWIGMLGASAITGAVTLVGQAWNFSHRLNGTATTIERMDKKLSETCDTLITQGKAIVELQTHCRDMHGRK